MTQDKEQKAKDKAIRAEKRALKKNEKRFKVLSGEKIDKSCTSIRFITTPLPTGPVKTHIYETRVNGYALKMTSMAGVPYGSYARLILMYLMTYASRKGTPLIPMPRSMNQFVTRTLGFDDHRGGARGVNTAVIDQMKRILTTQVNLERPTGTGVIGENMMIVDTYFLWKTFEPADNVVNIDSAGYFILLTDKFYKQIVKVSRGLVPIDMAKVKYLLKSPLAVDLYCWLTHKNHQKAYHKTMSWAGLWDQFGPGFNDERSFRQKFKAAIKKVQEVYPAPIRFTDEGIILLPFESDIAPRIST